MVVVCQGIQYNHGQDMELTNKEILEDISDFTDRIQAAKTKLSELPGWAETYKERLKIKNKRYFLESEIMHVQNLIKIAQTGLKDL